MTASSGTGAEPRGSGPRRRGAACWTAPGHGSRTARGAAACGAAGRAAAGAQREVLRLSGVVHAVGPLPCWARKRVLQHPARAARKAVGCAARNAHGQPRRCRRANSRASQRSSNLPAVGARAAAPSASPPGSQRLRLRPRRQRPPLLRATAAPRRAPPPARAAPPCPGGAPHHWAGLQGGPLWPKPKITVVYGAKTRHVSAQNKH